MDKWVSESYELLQNNESSYYRGKMTFSNKYYSFGRDSVKNKLPGIVSADDLFSSKGFRFFFCDAAYGSVSVGPDGRLHGCHSNAINKLDSDVVSSEDDSLVVNASKRLELVYEWLTKSMRRSVCSGCSMKYICGGGCFNEEQPNASCTYLNKMFPIILTQMNVFWPKEVERTASRTQKVFGELYQLKDALEDKVTSEDWTLLLSGKLPIGGALRLAEKYSRCFGLT